MLHIVLKRAILKLFRSALCDILKKVLFWNIWFISTLCNANFVLLTASNICLFNWFHTKYHYIPYWHTNKHTNAVTLTLHLDSFCTGFYASKPCISNVDSMWKSLRSANLKHISDWHIFQNGAFEIGTQHTYIFLQTKKKTHLFQPCQTWSVFQR